MRVVLLVVAVVLAVPAAADGFARPTEPKPSVYGQPGYSVAEQPPHCGSRVCVHWVAEGVDKPADTAEDPNDADAVPESIEFLLGAFERAYDIETGRLGWRAPAPDGERGGGSDLVDVYVKDLQGRAAGVAARDDDPAVRFKPSGFIILDARYIRPDYTSYLLNTLAPHELQHLVEYSYDGFFESWFAEATAEWQTQEVAQDQSYVRSSLAGWSELTEAPLLGVLTGQIPPEKAYLSDVWTEWLAQRHGRAVVRAVWEENERQVPFSFHPLSVDRALAASGKASTFFDELVRFAVAHAEWRTPDAGFGLGSDFGDVERVGALATGAAEQPVELDHTTFALLDVPVVAGQAVTLRAEAPDGLQSAVALVGRRGGAEDGRLEVVVRPLPEGGTVAVGLPDPERFERITAVLVNADATRASDRKDAFGQWTYARDDQPFTARTELTADPPPAPSAPAEPVTQTAPSRDAPLPAAPPLVGEDLLAPVLRALRVDVPALRSLRAGRSVRAAATFGEPTRLAATLSLGGRVIAQAKDARRTTRPAVTLRLDRAARRALARAARTGRAPALSLRLVATDAAGNARTLTRRLRPGSRPATVRAAGR